MVFIDSEDEITHFTLIFQNYNITSEDPKTITSLKLCMLAESCRCLGPSVSLLIQHALSVYAVLSVCRQQKEISHMFNHSNIQLLEANFSVCKLSFHLYKLFFFF